MPIVVVAYIWSLAVRLTTFFSRQAYAQSAPYLYQWSSVVELDWQAATAAGANNGKVDWWLDGTQQTGVSGIDNDTRRIDRVRLGAVSGVDATTNGTTYFDAFESRRSTYIGPIAGGAVMTTITFAYDALYRLKDVVYATGDEFHYQYDAVGNALSYTRTVSGLTVTTNYTYNEANQLLTAQASNDPTVWHYLYDNNGSLTDLIPNGTTPTNGARRYTYDAAGRLTQAELHDGVSYQPQADMVYDGLGHRLGMTGWQGGLSATTTYALDMTTQNDTLLSATSSGNTTYYLYAQGRPLAELTATWAYYLNDATQTPRQLVDATGNVTLVRTYTPWGEVLSQSGTGNFTWGYFGGLMDAATGLLYVGGGQYYDPVTGRFLTPVNRDGTNPYVPQRGGDPLGAVLAPFGLLMLARKRKGGKYDRLILMLVLIAAAGGALAACGTPSPAPTNTSQPTTQPPPTKTPKPTDTPIPTPTSIYQNCRYPYENGKFNEGAFRACRADSLRLTNALSSAGFQYEPRETWSGNDQEKYFNWNAQSPCSASGPGSLSDQCIFFQKPDNLVAVVLHHTGSEIEVPIQNLESGTDGVDIAFHFLVKKNGTVVEGRPMLVRGAAAPGGNIGSVSIEIEGNFHENKNVPRREQIQATIALINAIKPGTRLQYFSTHRDIYQSWVNYDPESLPAQQSTDCPGQFFYTALTQGPLLDEFEKMTGLEYRPSPFTWGVKIPGVATSTPTP